MQHVAMYTTVLERSLHTRMHGPHKTCATTIINTQHVTEAAYER